MQYIIHIINLLEILVYISDHEYLIIMNAKFHSSMMNIVHTMSPANMLTAQQKSYGQQHSFWILSVFLYGICVGHWPADLGVDLWSTFELQHWGLQQWMYTIDLKQYIYYYYH